VEGEDEGPDQIEREQQRRYTGHRPPCYRAATLGLSVGQQAVELGVTLVDTGLHAGGDHAVAILNRVEDAQRLDPAATATEADDRHDLEHDRVRIALERERLHDALGLAQFVEGAVETDALLSE